MLKRSETQNSSIQTSPPTFLHPLNLTHSTHSTPKRLRCARKEVEKGVGRPQVVGGKSSMCAMKTGHGSREPVCSLEGAKQLPRRAAAEPHAFRPRHAARQWKTGRKGSQIALRSTEFLYQVARVVMTARQRDGLSQQPAASPAASRRRGSRQPGSHTRWQHPPTHTDVDARVALPRAGPLSRAQGAENASCRQAVDRQRTVEQAAEPMGAPRRAFDAGRFAARAQDTDEQAVRGVALVVSAAEDVADAIRPQSRSPRSWRRVRSA